VSKASWTATQTPWRSKSILTCTTLGQHFFNWFCQ